MSKPFILSLFWVSLFLVTAGCSGAKDDEGVQFADGGCEPGFEQQQDFRCGPAICVTQGELLCLRRCSQDTDCHRGNRCSQRGYFNGGDYSCNVKIHVCRNKPDEC